MQPPWTISHLFLILLTVCDRGISKDLEGSEADVVANATNAQKQITERQKRLIPYKAYYVTQAQSNPIKELRGFFAVPTTPKDVESNAAHAVTGSQNDHQKHHHHTLTIFPSTISAGKSKPYYDFEKSTNNFQIFRSVEPIHPVKEKISGITISPQWTAPVQLITLIPHIPGASTRKTPTQGSISNINIPRTMDPSNRSPTFDENNSSGERKVHTSVNENRESPSRNDGRSQILLKTFTFSPNGASAVKALRHGNSDPNKFEGSTPDVSKGKLVETKTPSNPDQPVEAKKKNRGQPKTTYRDHQTPNIRLKVPQENEIRFVVNLNPVRAGHGTPYFGKHVEKEPGLEIENQTNKPRTQNGFLSVLKETNRLPKNLTPENIDSGIKTLALILERLQKEKQIENIQSAFTRLDSDDVAGPKDVSGSNPAPYQKHQSFPQASGTSTPGRPGVDYPIHSTIPQTSFDCATQRYKGFFGDPETKCQVWHYCDLNGGQASFLCPNGTIFSQVALTCDWWFNVKCASTLQLYVLNERLYKYILPFRPSFPEDYTGPLVDKYLTAKFTEMERKSKLQALKSLSTTTTPTSKPQQKSK